MNSPGIRKSTALLLAGCFGWQAPAIAQTANSAEAGSGDRSRQQADAVAEGDIIVTATRQDQLLSRVPVSVAAYTAERMDQQGVRDITDIARLTPGLNFSRDTFGSGTSTNISIRGISSQSGAATTGVYIDDVSIQIRSNSQTAFGSAFPRIFDLDRIEVLRGPQGTLFGAGAQGGVVRFITPTPNLNDTSIYARGELATTRHGDASYEAGVAAGTPLVTDKVGLRVSAYYRRDGGFVDRKPTNSATPDSTDYFKNVNRNDTYVARAALTLEPIEGLSIVPSFYYQRMKVNDSGALWGSLSDLRRGKFVSGYAVQQSARDRFFLPSLTVTADLGAVTVTSVTGYFDRKGSSIQDYSNLDANFIFGKPIPFVAGWVAPGTATARQKALSQEVRLSSADPTSSLRWTVGAYYSRSKQIESIKTQDDTVAALLPLEAIFGIGLADGRYIFTSGNNTVDKQFALFGQADYDITDALTATVGLRYSWTTFDYRRDLGGPLNYIGSGPPTTTVVGQQKSEPFTPKFGLNYRFDKDNMVYASVAKGFRTGGVNPPLFASCQIQNAPTSYAPDTTWSYEVGAKNRLFGGVLRTEFSTFLIDWKNIQQFVLAGCAGNGFRDNLGSARSKGFDLQATLRVSADLSLSGAVGYVDAKFRETVILNNIIYARKGDALEGSPWQLAGNIDYSTQAFANGKAYFHGDVRYNSHNKGDLVTRDDPAAIGFDPSLRFNPAITEVNLRVGVRVSGVDASVFVNNLFDKSPLLNKSHDVESSPLFYYNTIRPRTIGLTLTYRR